MSEVAFHFNAPDKLAYACRLLRKAVGSGARAVVLADARPNWNFEPIEFKEMMQIGHDLFRLIETLDKPVIGVAKGGAVGGGLEMLHACDFVIASDRATFGFPEVRLGVPTIVVVGKRLAEGFIELRDRRTGDSRDVMASDALPSIVAVVRRGFRAAACEPTSMSVPLRTISRCCARARPTGGSSRHSFAKADSTSSG